MHYSLLEIIESTQRDDKTNRMRNYFIGKRILDCLKNFLSSFCGWNVYILKPHANAHTRTQTHVYVCKQVHAAKKDLVDGKNYPKNILLKGKNMKKVYLGELKNKRKTLGQK